MLTFTGRLPTLGIVGGSGLGLENSLVALTMLVCCHVPKERIQLALIIGPSATALYGGNVHNWCPGLVGRDWRTIISQLH